MATKEVAPREKRELTQTQERTEAGKFFSPYTDIHETERVVVVSMEMPGVDKDSIDIRLDKGVLTVKGTIDSAKYEALRPIYSEYNVGNFVRTFDLGRRRRRRAHDRAAEGSRGRDEAHRRAMTLQRARALTGRASQRPARPGRACYGERSPIAILS